MGKGRQRAARPVDLGTCTDQFVTVHELAAYWRVSVTVIRRDVRKGALASVRVGTARAIRIPIDAARRYGQPSSR